jgi:hypothetical protein
MAQSIIELNDLAPSIKDLVLHYAKIGNIDRFSIKSKGNNNVLYTLIPLNRITLGGVSFSNAQDLITAFNTSSSTTIDNTILLENIAENTKKLNLENVTYSLVGNKNIVFAANTINSYSMMIEAGQAKFKEVNETGWLETNRGLSGSLDNRLLPNEIKITNKDAISVTTICVLQFVGTMPTITDN